MSYDSCHVLRMTHHTTGHTVTQLSLPHHLTLPHPAPPCTTHGSALHYPKPHHATPHHHTTSHHQLAACSSSAIVALPFIQTGQTCPFLRSLSLPRLSVLPWWRLSVTNSRIARCEERRYRSPPDGQPILSPPHKDGPAAHKAGPPQNSGGHKGAIWRPL